MTSQSDTGRSPPSRILCVGMCVIDFIHVTETYPTEDTDKRCLAGYWQRGGNASNNATVIKLLGAPQTEFLGMLSDSPICGAYLKDDMARRGILYDNCPHTSQDPPFSSVILAQDSGSRTIIHSNPSFPILRYEHFKSLDLTKYGWIHFEARNPEETIRMMRDIRAYNASKASYDEKVKVSLELEKLREDHLALAEYANLIILGRDLAQHLGYTNAVEAVRSLRARLKASAESNYRAADIICPWGSEGSAFLDCNDDCAQIPAKPPTRIVDSLGAGDTFCGTVIYARQELRLSLRQATEMANLCAGYKLGHRGYDAIKHFHANLQKEN